MLNIEYKKVNFVTCFMALFGNEYKLRNLKMFSNFPLIFRRNTTQI